MSLHWAENRKAYEGVEVKHHTFLTAASRLVRVSCKPTELDDRHDKYLLNLFAFRITP